MVGLLPIAAIGGLYLLTKKKGGGGIGKITKAVDVNKGLLGDAVKGIGAGTLVNVADKKFLGGRVTRLGIPLGRSINGKALTLNATDVLTYFVVSGGLKVDKKHIGTGLATVGAKKIAELYDWIDPPFSIPSSIASMNAGISKGARSPGMLSSTIPKLNLVS